ncbi:uncharacterized protein TNCV_1900321 [Trichonephila clavipes]|nr:uncharacterized protein TNCV_1900321 [Trichonephila clavipes]
MLWGSHTLRSGLTDSKVAESCWRVSDQQCGIPQTTRNAVFVEQVKNRIVKNRSLTVREIAEQVEISAGFARAILYYDLNMSRVVAKFVPKLLSLEQKELCLAVSQDRLDTSKAEPSFLTILENENVIKIIQFSE